MNFGFSTSELDVFLGKNSAASSSHSLLLTLDGKIFSELNEDNFFTVFGVRYIKTHRFFTMQDFEFFLRQVPMLFRVFRTQYDVDLASFLRERFFNGFDTFVYIRWISKDKGYGAFSVKEIPKGTIIGEYAGQVTRSEKNSEAHNPFCFHYPTKFFSWNYAVIDAFHYGNELRFLNHSDAPNLETLWVIDRNILHLVFIAKDDIKAHTELTFSYGKHFFNKYKKE